MVTISHGRLQRQERRRRNWDVGRWMEAPVLPPWAAWLAAGSYLDAVLPGWQGGAQATLCLWRPLPLTVMALPLEWCLGARRGERRFKGDFCSKEHLMRIPMPHIEPSKAQ